MKNFKNLTATRKLKIQFGFLVKNYGLDALIGLILAFIFSMLLSFNVHAQNVGINNPAPHAKSLLDLTASDKGLLTPRMTAAQRIAMFPAADATAKGMLVYQTDLITGFYYFDGTAWQFLNNGASGWGLNGNTGTLPVTNFLGTTDSVDFSVRTNNLEIARFTANKKIGIGTATPVFSYSKVEIADETGANSDLSLRCAGVGFSDLNFLKSQGTLGAPTATAANTVNGSLTNYAYDGSKYMLSSRIIFAIDSNATVNDVAGSIRFYPANNNVANEALRIASSGNIGIANSNPLFPLSFANAIGDKICLWGTPNNYYGLGIQPSELQMYVPNSNGDMTFGYGSSSLFTERMRIKGNGKVGIGTKSPGSLYSYAAVEIADSTGNNKDLMLRSSSAISHSSLLLARTRGTLTTPLSVINGEDLGRVSGMGYDGTVLKTAAEIQFHVDSVPGANKMPGNITFHTASTTSGGTPLERMRIDRNGNTGIGKSNPLQKLDVQGNINIMADSNYRINNNRVLSTKGLANLFVGTHAGLNTSSGGYNTFVGYVAGINNTTGGSNAFFGQYSGFNNLSGTFNTFLGNVTGSSNTTGTDNVYVGSHSGNAGTTGSSNVFVGSHAGFNNTVSDNVFVGTLSGYSNTTGTANTMLGTEAGMLNTAGMNNTFIGFKSGRSSTANNNTFTGWQAGSSSTSGQGNSFYGSNTGYSNTTGEFNAFFGTYAGGSSSTGSNNNCMGFFALGQNVSGSSNVATGNLAGFVNTTGSNNTFLGSAADATVNNLNNSTALGYNSKISVSNAIALGQAGTLVGIGNPSPGFALNFAATTGDKISLFGNTGAHYGFGVQGSLLQIHSATNIDDIGFGTGSSAAFTELARIKGNGNMGIGTPTPLTKLEIEGGLTLGDDATIIANTIPFILTVGNRSYFRIGADNAPSSRILTLSNGLQTGQLLIIECAAVGTSGIRLADNAANNTNMNMDRDLMSGDIVTLIWNGNDWMEVSYSNN